MPLSHVKLMARSCTEGLAAHLVVAGPAEVVHHQGDWSSSTRTACNCCVLNAEWGQQQRQVTASWASAAV